MRLFDRIALEFFAEAASETSAAFFIKGKFARRQQAYFADGVDTSLRIYVKGANRFDFVIQQIDAVRQRAAHGKQIDQAAAHAVFAWRKHLGDVAVTRQSHLSAERDPDRAFRRA